MISCFSDCVFTYHLLSSTVLADAYDYMQCSLFEKFLEFFSILLNRSYMIFQFVQVMLCFHLV